MQPSPALKTENPTFRAPTKLPPSPRGRCVAAALGGVMRGLVSGSRMPVCRRRTVQAFQPWFSRTWIMAARMSFQVCCRSITSLGNMQPSQQMCLNFLVTLPVSSRSQ